MSLVWFAWLIVVSGTGLWFLEGQGFFQKPVHHVQQNTHTQQHRNTSTCPYFSTCLPLLVGEVWVHSVCGLFISTLSLKSNEVVFLRGLLRHKVVQGSMKTSLPNCMQLLPSRASIQPRHRNSYFPVFEEQHFRVFLHPVSLSREACSCRTVCWAWLSKWQGSMWEGVIAGKRKSGVRKAEVAGQNFPDLS